MIKMEEENLCKNQMGNPYVTFIYILNFWKFNIILLFQLEWNLKS